MKDTPPRLFETMREVGVALLAILHTRMGLASVELSEERDRLLLRALLGVSAVFAMTMAMAMATLLVVIVFWDTWRLQVLTLFLLLYAGLGIWCLTRFKALARQAPPLLEQTMAELERDIEAIRR